MTEYSFDQVMQALRNADAAGDTAAAKRLARIADGMRQQPAQQNADGTYGQVPEGMFVNPETGQMTSREMLANNVDTSRGGAAAQGASQGLSFGFMDEAVGALGSLEGEGMGRLRREQMLAELDASRRDFGGTTMGAEIAGALVVPGGAARQATTTGGRIMAGAATGAAQGGVYGAGAAETGERFEGAQRGALIGGAAGGAIGGVLDRASRGARARTQRRNVSQAVEAAPTTQGLRNEASQIFNSVDNRGVAVTGDAYEDFSQRVVGAATEAGIDRTITPKAYAAMKRLTGQGKSRKKGRKRKPLKLGEIDTIRRIANNAATSPDPNERRIAGQMVEAIDDFVLRLSEDDLTSGNIAGLGDDLKKARGLWRRMRTSETIEQAVERARDTASGFENGIRIEFRRLLRTPQFARQLSDAEKEAMREVVQGSAVGNTLKRLSKLGFGSGQQTNMLGGMVGTGLGGVAAGPVGAMMAPVIGQVAGRGAERATLNAAERARAVIASPQRLAELPAPAQRAALVRPAPAVSADENLAAQRRLARRGR